GLHVHAGHGLDYRNIMPLLAISEIASFSIGFAIIARAVFVGLAAATAEMKQLMMRGTVATEIIDSRVTGVETQKSALQP
ncbi:MAG: pyridoxine 5'-phosphate synthase, partial [candidate division WOR-3 bacterium]